VRLPPIVRDVYRIADGFAPADQYDAEGFRFWPLSEVEPVSTYEGGEYFVSGAETWFLFADYMLWSWPTPATCLTSERRWPHRAASVIPWWSQSPSRSSWSSTSPTTDGCINPFGQMLSEMRTNRGDR
jgi:hypothetical protein